MKKEGSRIDFVYSLISLFKDRGSFFSMVWRGGDRSREEITRNFFCLVVSKKGKRFIYEPVSP